MFRFGNFHYDVYINYLLSTVLWFIEIYFMSNRNKKIVRNYIYCMDVYDWQTKLVNRGRGGSFTILTVTIDRMSLLYFIWLLKLFYSLTHITFIINFPVPTLQCKDGNLLFLSVSETNQNQKKIKLYWFCFGYGLWKTII